VERKKTENKKNQDERKQNYYSLGQGRMVLAVWSNTNRDVQSNTTETLASTLPISADDSNNSTRSSIA
jgi:hypothetical protein